MGFNKEIEELKAKITPMNTAKFVIGTLVSLGATAAVFAVMKGGLAGSKGLTKLLMKLGIFVIACKAGDVAKDYFDKSVDEYAEDFKDVQKTVKEAAESE